MNRYIDIYCERLEPGLWSEPVNAITNISFFIAAICALWLARQEGKISAGPIVLIALVAIIGTGSSLFHTYATVWAMLSDSIPILFYQIAFIILYARFVMDLSWLKVGGIFAAFMAMTIGIYQLPHDLLNGSLGYGPALLFLAGFAFWHLKHATQERFVLLMAVVTFAISLTFRSVDMMVCESLPLGTHFMWHILNGVVLYLTTRAYIKNI